LSQYYSGGAVDFIATISDNFLLSLSDCDSTKDSVCIPDSFWKLASECRKDASDIIKRGFVQESVRLFGLGMRCGTLEASYRLTQNLI